MADKYHKTENTIGLIQALQIVGEPNMYYPIFSHTCDSLTCGVFLSKMLYWEGKQRDPNGWIYKTQSDITKETGLSRYETDALKKKLVAFEILEIKKAGIPAKTYYRFHWSVLEQMVLAYNKQEEREQESEPGEKEKAKTRPIIHQMIDMFKKYHSIEYSENPYNFTSKDFGHLKNLEKAFIAQIKARTPEKEMIEDKDVLESWDIFLSKLPKHYKEKQFFPSGLYSNFSAIIQEIRNEYIKNKSTKSNIAENIKTSGGATTSSRFADQVRTTP